MTVLRGKRRTATFGTLPGGLACLAVLYLFGVPTRARAVAAVLAAAWS